MKVLYIASPGLGGANISLALLIKRLEEKGIEAKVIVANKEYLSFFRRYNISVDFVPVKFTTWPAYCSWYEKISFIPRLIVKLCYTYAISFMQLRRKVKQFKPDLIHTNVSCFSVGHLVANSLSIPHVYHVREYGDLDFGWNLYPSFKGYSKRLQSTYSIAITKDIAKHFSLKPPKNRVIYNGISDGEINQDDYYTKGFLYVGYITENKGFSELVRAYCQYVANGGNTKLYVAGSGEENYLNKEKDYIDCHNCAENVIFLGQCTNVNQIMASAKAIIVCSKNEGFGRITAEAMFNKCLVIGRNTGGTKEQFDNGVELSGGEIGIRYLKEEELSKSLTAVDMMLEEEKDAIKKRALKTVTELYTLDKCAGNVLHFYEEILNNHVN